MENLPQRIFQFIEFWKKVLQLENFPPIPFGQKLYTFLAPSKYNFRNFRKSENRKKKREKRKEKKEKKKREREKEKENEKKKKKKKRKRKSKKRRG